MRRRTTSVVSGMVWLAAWPCLASDLKGPYLGQRPPGLTLQVFSPGVISVEGSRELYWDFASQTGDIYVARQVHGRHAEPIILGPPISTEYSEVRPTIDPDERYLLFVSDRPGGYGGNDVYIAFRNTDGTWSSPKNLGPTVNTPADDDVPNISPDGRYWFSVANGDVYWMEARAALPDPEGPIRSLKTGRRFGAIQAAVSLAEPGEVIEVPPGTYHENLVLPDVPLTIRSTDVRDPSVVSRTVLTGDRGSPVVRLWPGASFRSIEGLTIAGGEEGTVASGERLQLKSCVVLGHRN